MDIYSTYIYWTTTCSHLWCEHMRCSHLIDVRYSALEVGGSKQKKTKTLTSWIILYWHRQETPPEIKVKRISSMAEENTRCDRKGNDCMMGGVRTDGGYGVRVWLLFK